MLETRRFQSSPPGKAKDDPNRSLAERLVNKPCRTSDWVYCAVRPEPVMKKEANKPVEQPKPVTPGVTKAQVRQHAYELYRDKLGRGGLTLQDWVLAEKDLVKSMEDEA